MVDLETLGIGPRAAFIEIGACKFDIVTGDILDTIFIPIHWESVVDGDCNRLKSELVLNSQSNRIEKFKHVNEGDILDYFGITNDKREVDGSTVKWWLLQSNEACRSLVGNNGVPIAEALELFADWFGEDDIIWGNGSTFDVSKLEDAYGTTTPWKYYNINDCRTIERFSTLPRTDAPFEGIKHNSVDDAIYQAQYITQMLRHL